MATGWDAGNGIGVLDGSVGYGVVEWPMPVAPPAGLKQLGLFLQIRYNTFASHSYTSVIPSWLEGHYWGFKSSAGAPDDSDLSDAGYSDFLGVVGGASGGTTRVAVNAQNNTADARRDYAGAFRSSNIAGYPLSYLAGAKGSLHINYLKQLSDVGPTDEKTVTDMLHCIPRDPTVNGVLVFNIVASEVDNTVDLEMWLSPVAADFSAISWNTFDLANIGNTFPNTNGWYGSYELNDSASTGTNWRDGSGNFIVPDRFVARYPMNSGKMEFQRPAYVFRT